MIREISIIAIESRIFIIVLQVFFNNLIPDHDAKVFNPPVTQTSVVDRLIDIMFGGFRRWDALYFLHIAEHGYSYENTLAFFPLFPLSIRAVANSLLLPLQYCASYANVLLMSAVLVNFLSFILSATTLYQLSKQILHDNALAYRAVQLYCVNPASIFFSAAYSEPMYALLAWQGMLSIERNRRLFAACCFALSGAVRSNGLINVGFVVYWLLRKLCARIGERGKTSVSGLGLGLCLDMFLAAFYTVICLVPFIIFQYFAFTVFCNPAASYRDLPTDVRRYGTEQGYKMPYSGLSAWCHFAVPLSYSYVQSTHWNVGLFKYYELKQLPNFALATPIVLLTSYAAYAFVRNYPVHCLTLGLKNLSEKFEQKKKNDDVTPPVSTCRPLLPPSCFVYVVHVTCLLAFGVLCMHVQVLTRFISSSSPVIFWLAAAMTKQPSSTCAEPPVANIGADGLQAEVVQSRSEGEFSSWSTSWSSRLVVVYFHFYLFVGTAAFSNFLPWT